LASSAFEKFTFEGSPLYKAKLAQALGILNTTSAEKDDGGTRRAQTMVSTGAEEHTECDRCSRG
jgi:hypothetical protein